MPCFKLQAKLTGLALNGDLEHSFLLTGFCGLKEDVMFCCRIFDTWTQAHFSESKFSILEGDSVDAERVANLLVGYGRSLYYAGRPYGVYSETINAVTSKRGTLRMLGLAWDLAFSWVADLITQRYPAVFCWQYLHWPCCGRGLRRQVFFCLHGVACCA